MEVDLIEKIKGVFMDCESEGSGFITTEQLQILAKEHLGTENEEDLLGIVQLLDPEGSGKVNFQDLCEQILQAQSKLPSTPTNTLDTLDVTNSFKCISHSTPEAQDASSTFTFQEYDTADSNTIEFSTPETSHGHSSGRSSETSYLKTDEENYEDYGAVDLESDSSDAYLSGDRYNRSRRSLRHRSKGPNRRITASAHASQLSRSVASPTHSDIYDEIDGNFQELTDRIKFLENQLVKVTDDKSRDDEVKNRYKDENTILIKSVVDRIHGLEEQLKDMEVKSNERVRVEQRKYQEIVNKHGFENEKLDYLTKRLETFESENDQLKTEVVRLKNEKDRLRMDKMEVADRLAAMEEDYNRVSAENEEMMAKFDREQHITGNLLDELQMELEDLRKFKIECEHKHGGMPRRTSSIPDTNGYLPLQEEMQKLKEANRHLAEENEELNAQLLARAVQEGRHMLQEGSSLAAELDHLTKEELTTKLREQQDMNVRLSAYVDKILLSILEKNPAILEIR